jgi:hypothetical protein
MNHQPSNGSPHPRAAFTGGGLAAANAIFHEAYAEARTKASNSVPILIILGDELILRRGPERRGWSFATPAFDDLKIASHVIVTTRCLVGAGRQGSLSDTDRARLSSLREILERVGKDAASTGGQTQKAVSACLSLLDGVLRDARVPAPNGVAWEASKALLEELMSEAARLRLLSLHATVGEALGALEGDARRALRVVVAGDHQARRRSHGMQYFERRLPPLPNGEPRVAYGESVTSEEEAFDLVGTALVDRALATTLFGDPNKMQEDLLGEATRLHLDAMNLSPIE